jgi:hypothetical protein
MPPNIGRQMNHNVRVGPFINLLGIGLFDQVAHGATRDEYFSQTESSKFRDHPRTQEPRPSRDQNSFVGLEIHF